MINAFFLAALLLTFSIYAKDVNNGEDVTRPINRFDIRAKLQTGVGSQNGQAFVFTLRSDIAISLKHKWQMALRVDAPFESFYCPKNSCCISCQDARHMGDSLLQIFLITPNYTRWAFGIGIKGIFPTGGKQLEIGDGKYQILPSFAFRYHLDSTNKENYIGAIFRHASSYAGYPNASQISQTFIQPFFNFNLPAQWFINSSPEIFYDWQSHRWFIPFDLMIGKMITKALIISVEYEAAIIYGYPSYWQQLEFRIGLFF